MSKGKHYLSIQTRPNHYEYFSVPEPVHIYVIQLEMALKYPKHSKLTERYPHLKPREYCPWVPKEEQ